MYLFRRSLSVNAGAVRKLPSGNVALMRNCKTPDAKWGAFTTSQKAIARVERYLASLIQYFSMVSASPVVGSLTLHQRLNARSLPFTLILPNNMRPGYDHGGP